MHVYYRHLVACCLVVVSYINFFMKGGYFQSVVSTIFYSLATTHKKTSKCFKNRNLKMNILNM